MNVNSVSQVSCKANPTKFARQINIPMKDGSETIMKLTDKSIDCVQHKGERVLGGYGHRHPDGIQKEEILNIYKSLSDNIKDGFDFLKEFFMAVSK